MNGDRDELLHVDLSEIEDLAAGDPTILSELIAMFVRHTHQAVEQTRVALADGKKLEAAAIAHTAIGFTATLGLTAMVPTLRQLERALREGSPEECVSLIGTWEREFGQIQRVLHTRLHRI